GSLKIVHNCSDNCFANFCRKLLGNDVRLFRFPQSWLHLSITHASMVLRSVCTTFQVHLRKRLKSEPANHEMIAKPIIVLPFKTGTPSFARLMVEAPEELFKN
ncbi:MAG: hypothetical protein Q4A08_09680, partial [Bacteroidales bacterium]|nr:hypothetical protein [Bacteroidales bacterium]